MSDNYTSIERHPSIVDAVLHPSPPRPQQPPPLRPRLAYVRERPLPHHLIDSSFVPTSPLHPVHRHRHRTLFLFLFHADSKLSSRDVANGHGERKRRPCRKSLYVPRVNGFFSDGVNSRVPTTDAVCRWGLGWIILIPSFLGVNVLSIYLFFLCILDDNSSVFPANRLNENPEDGERK